MPSLGPDPGFEYFFKACRKGDSSAKAVTVGESALYERLTLALTEALTALNSEDLQKWGFRSGLFTNLDK